MASKYKDNIIYVNGKQMDIESPHQNNSAIFEKIEVDGKMFWNFKLEFLVPVENTINIFETSENYKNDDAVIDAEKNVLILRSKRDNSDPKKVFFKLSLKDGYCNFTHNKEKAGKFNLRFDLEDTEKKDHPEEADKKDHAANPK